MTTLLDVITTATTNATAEIILRKHLAPDIADLTTALHKAVSEGYAPLLKEVNEAEFMGEPMMKEVLNAGCITLAIKALKEVGAL